MKVALIFILLASSASVAAADEPTKEARLAAAKGQLDACVDDQVSKLNDRISSADTIAAAAVAACRSYVDETIAIQLKGKNYWYKQSYGPAAYDASRQRATQAVLHYRTGK